MNIYVRVIGKTKEYHLCVIISCSSLILTYGRYLIYNFLSPKVAHLNRCLLRKVGEMNLNPLIFFIYEGFKHYVLNKSW